MVGVLLAAQAIPAARGAPLNWDGAISGGANGGNGTWDSNTTGNWWDGAADVVWPNSGTDNDAVFGGTLGAVTVVAVTANDITFSTGGYTLASGTLTLNGTTPTISAGTGIVATISSDIAGSAGLTKADSGTLTINASSSYGGPTSVSGGTLILKKAADTDANLVNSTVVVIDNATLKPDATTRNLYAGTDAVAHSLTAQNAGQINNFTGLYLGTTATSNSNTVLFTGTGTVVSCVNNTGGNKNLRVGDAGSSNTLTVAAGASLRMPKGNGSNDQTIGNLATATLNSMTVTGTNQNDSAFAGTGTLTVSGAPPPVTYASWASTMGIPGALPNDDYDHDGVANAVEMVLGGDPKNVMDAGLMPQLALVTDPAGVPAGDYLEFTYRRTDLSVSAGVAAACETATDLLGPWTTAVDGVDGVVVLVDNDYAPTAQPPTACGCMCRAAPTSGFSAVCM